jgi:hypothetical protein
MKNARAVSPESLIVLEGAVSFVVLKAVLRKHPVKGIHNPVSIDFRHHGSAGNASTDLVPPHEAALRNIDGNGVNTIHEEKVRSRVQGHYGDPHRFQRSPEDVILIDIGVRNDSYTDGRRLLSNDREGLLPALRGHLLGIPDPFQGGILRNNDCGSDNRAGQRSSPRLVYSCNDPVTGLNSRLFMKKRIGRRKDLRKKG